jgi:hypothetical protein
MCNGQSNLTIGRRVRESFVRSRPERSDGAHLSPEPSKEKLEDWVLNRRRGEACRRQTQPRNRGPMASEKVPNRSAIGNSRDPQILFSRHAGHALPCWSTANAAGARSKRAAPNTVALRFRRAAPPSLRVATAPHSSCGLEFGLLSLACPVTEGSQLVISRNMGVTGYDCCARSDEARWPKPPAGWSFRRMVACIHWANCPEV